MASVTQHGDGIAQAKDFLEAMRNVNDSDAALLQFVNLAHAALTEIDVADGERFVDEEDFGVHMYRDGEGEAD